MTRRNEYRAGDRVTTKTALLDALLLERYGSLHPEHRHTQLGQDVAADSPSIDQPSALRLITANDLDRSPSRRTGTEQ